MAEEETASQVDGVQHLPPSGISTPRTRPPPRTSATSPGDVVQSPSADQEALPSSSAGPGAFPSPRQLNSPAYAAGDVPYPSTTILSPGGNGSGGHDAFSMAAQLATTQDALKQSEREKQQLASFVDNVANRARHQRDVAQEAALAKVREVRNLQHEMGSVTAYLRKLQASMAQCVQQRESAVASLHRETARAATLEQQLAASREHAAAETAAREASDMKCKQLAAAAAALKADVDSLRRQVTDQARRAGDTSAAASSAREQLAAASVARQQAETALRDTRVALEKSSRDLQTLRAQHVDLERRWQQSQEELSSLSQLLESERRSTADERHATEEAHAAIVQLRAAAARSDAQMQAMQDRCRGFSEATQRVLAECTQALSSSSQHGRSSAGSDASMQQIPSSPPADQVGPLATVEHQLRRLHTLCSASHLGFKAMKATVDALRREAGGSARAASQAQVHADELRRCQAQLQQAREAAALASSEASAAKEAHAALQARIESEVAHQVDTATAEHRAVREQLEEAVKTATDEAGRLRSACRQAACVEIALREQLLSTTAQLDALAPHSTSVLLTSPSSERHSSVALSLPASMAPLSPRSPSLPRDAVSGSSPAKSAVTAFLEHAGCGTPDAVAASEGAVVSVLDQVLQQNRGMRLRLTAALARGEELSAEISSLHRREKVLQRENGTMKAESDKANERAARAVVAAKKATVKANHLSEETHRLKMELVDRGREAASLQRRIRSSNAELATLRERVATLARSQQQWLEHQAKTAADAATTSALKATKERLEQQLHQVQTALLSHKEQAQDAHDVLAGLLREAESELVELRQAAERAAGIETDCRSRIASLEADMQRTQIELQQARNAQSQAEARATQLQEQLEGFAVRDAEAAAEAALANKALTAQLDDVRADFHSFLEVCKVATSSPPPLGEAGAVAEVLPPGMQHTGASETNAASAMAAAPLPPLPMLSPIARHSTLDDMNGTAGSRSGTALDLSPEHTGS